MNELISKKVVKLGREIGVRPVLYYILNLTWGIPLTLLGFLLTLVLLPLLIFHPNAGFGRHMYTYYVVLPISRFGMSIGTMFFLGYDSEHSIDITNHEFGHTIQNAIFGPFMLFVVSLPSVIRWWYRYIYRRITKWKVKLPCYYSIWFEGSASVIGEYAYNENIQ